MKRPLRSPLRPRRRSAVALAVAVAAVGLSGALGVQSAQAATATGANNTAGAAHSLIQGSGSSWAANAVNQWIADVQPSGLQVVYTSNGSAQGRTDYANDTVDFAVSDIGYQGTDPATGAADSSSRPYVYLPIVAGGTALPYHIEVAGQLYRNLRLSGQTLAEIFTNKITNWDDPAITKDNNGHALPDLPIIPVVHSEGSGDSYHFTEYLNDQFGSTWRSFYSKGATEYFPRQGSQVAENGSDGVMNFISSSAGNGAIGYDEYSYALGKNYPVAKLLNKAGYFTLPNQYNVAVALTKAQINMTKSSKDYLLQKLQNVFTNPDPRTYPMSSYSYAIIPTSATDQKMTTAKRQTIADYLDFSVCGGQQQMGPIGYSPLPINLVQASFDQIKKLKTADKNVDVSQSTVTACNNPTFVANHPTENHLAQIAPQPPACDKVGAGPCTGTVDTGTANPTGGKAPTPAGNSNGGSTNTGGGANTGGTGSTTGTANTGGGTTTGSTGTTGTVGGGGTLPGVGTGSTSNQLPGVTSGSDATGQQVASGGGAVLGSSTVLAASQSHSVSITLAIVAGVLLLGVLVVPPLVAQRMRRRSTAP